METGLSQASRREQFRDLRRNLIVETAGATCRGSTELIRWRRVEIKMAAGVCCFSRQMLQVTGAKRWNRDTAQ
jgi:hypothetical protein